MLCNLSHSVSLKFYDKISVFIQTSLEIQILSFDSGLKDLIIFQTKLHDTVCNRRVAATIATHDLGLVAPGQLVYTAMLPSDLKIRPLNRSCEYTGIELFSQLQQEAESLRKEKKRNVYSGIHKYVLLINSYTLILIELYFFVK